MIVSNIRNFCLKLNRSMRTLVTPHYSKRYLGTTTSRWRRRFLLIPLMVQLVIVTFGILISWSLQQLQLAVSYLYDGLKKALMNISIKFLKLTRLTTLLQAIQTVCILHLINLLLNSFQRELRLKKLSTSWIRLQVRSWNLLLIGLINFLLRR